MYDRDQAHQLLREELTGTEYQREFTGPVREAIDDFLRWLQEDALDFGIVNVPAGPLVVVLLLAAAITVILLVVRPRLQRSGSAEQEVDIAVDVTAEQLRHRADRHAQDRNYDDAARDRFRALVRGAEERGLLRSAKGRTATELAWQLAGLFGDHADQLRSAAELFNGSRYGSTQLSAGHYEQLRTLDTELLRADPTASSGAGGPKLVVPQ